MSTQDPEMLKDQVAIVIGAGVGGLVAAAVLAERFREVIIFDKDYIPTTATPRKGIGQEMHLHSLLTGGLELLEQVFPDVRDELLSAGAIELRAGVDQQVFEYGQWMPSRDLGFSIFAQSRTLLEHVIRKLTLQKNNISLRERTRVMAVNQNDQGEVCGVSYKDSDSQAQQAMAKVVVDASGRGRKFVTSLADEFEDFRAEDTIDSNVIYGSVFLKKPEEFRHLKENILIVPEPSHSAGGALIDIEHDRWVVSLHGRNGIAPPSDFDGWKEFAKRLPDDRIYQRIKEAEAEGPVKIFKKPTSSWRRFDKAASYPNFYFPLGDTITSVNPTFGQGMTVAFGHAVSLRETLTNAEDLSAITAQYMKAACLWSKKAWVRGYTYDLTFLPADDPKAKNRDILKRLAEQRHVQAMEDATLHEEMVLHAQMLK